MSEVVPKLWSDFDGTAVAVAKKTDPRNWSKYPLPGAKGYADFLRGVSSTGVEVAGIVSRRPDVFVRRLVTARSIANLGYAEFFPESSQVIHAGSEKAKGRFVVEQSQKSTIGMLEDKPHKLGAVLLEALQDSDRPVFRHYPIIVGVVSHKKSVEYIDRLAEQAQAMESRGVVVSETDPITSTGLSIRSESMSLDVVQLQPYSQPAGTAFGHMLLNLTA